MPGPHDLVAKVLQLPNIPRDAIVGKVTIEYRSQPGALFAGRQVPMGPAPVLDRGQRAGKPAFSRGLPHHVLALPRLCPRVGEAKEVERVGLAVWRHPAKTLRAEVDEVRLVRVQRKAEPAKPFPQHLHNPLGVLIGLKGHHEVVGESYKSRLPFQAWLHLALEPCVQHIVQENVREHW